MHCLICQSPLQSSVIGCEVLSLVKHVFFSKVCAMGGKIRFQIFTHTKQMSSHQLNIYFLVKYYVFWSMKKNYKLLSFQSYRQVY